MAWYCVACKKEIPTGEEVLALPGGGIDAERGEPHHAACVVGYVAPAERHPRPRTAVKEVQARLLVQRLRADGGVESWLELPSTLKQPLMAMAAECAEGKAQVDYPVPGGDRLVIRRVAPRGYLEGIHLRREPVGFPDEGRDVHIDSESLPLFIAQLRGV